MRYPIICDRCGEAFDRHPVLEVACSFCGARVGESCRPPSTYQGKEVRPHAPRVIEARRSGKLHHCRATQEIPAISVTPPSSKP